MKKVILTVSAFIFSLKLMAQAPEKMSYQAVVRNSSNGLVISAPVGMRISILQGSAAGASVYTETQTVNSNANGLVSLEIGSGTVVSGNFSTIDWSADTYFIQTETDPTGGTTYTVTGTSQLMSVPYALHAKSAETVINNDDADADPANEIELPSGGNNGQVLNTDGSGNYTWVDQTVNTLPDGTVPGQTAYWDGSAWVVTTNLYNNGGNIGIGTTNPTTAKLVIEGNPGEMGLDLSSTDQYANMRVLRNPDGDNAMYIGLGSGSASQTHFYTNDLEVMTLNGGVGIGTTTPTQPLDVVGNVQFSGALMPNNTAGTTGQVLTSAGAGTAPTWTTPASTSNIYSADGTLAGNRVVTQGANTLGFTASAVNAFSVDGTTLSVDASNNRVGIGTAAPTNNFHVATTTLGAGITVSGPTPGYRLSPTAGATIAFGAANIANEWATGTATNDAVVVNQHATGKLILATGSAAAARMTITPTGNVGIGTTTPSGALHVNGQSGASSWTYIQGNTGGGGASNPSATITSGLMMGWNATNIGGESEIIFGSGSGTDPKLNFATWNGTTKTQIMSMNDNGNVGIGTINPTQPLDVVGNMKFSGALMPNNTAGTTGQVLTSAGAGAAPTWTTPATVSTLYSADGTLAGNRVVTQGANTLGFTSTAVNGFSVDGTTFSVDAANNRVGIGNTSPVERLTVAGSIQLSGFTSPTGLIVEEAGGTALNLSMNFRESNKTNTLKGGALRVDGRAGFPTFQFYTRAAGSAIETTAMVINEANNVGIGTSAPTSKLQVVGLPVYADNTAAIAGGLTAGAFYRTATGVLMVAF